MRSSSLVTSLAVGVLLASASGCGSDAGGKGSAAPAARAASATPAEHFFPLVEGEIFHYVTEENAEPGMLVAKVHRTDATHAELRLSNATKRFVYAPDGVAYDTGAYILKAPLERGTSWPGEHGGTTRIDATDAAVKVLAGAFSGCIRTVEEGGRPPGSRYTTTYCPGVGMVLLEVVAAGGEARAELKHHGPPVRIP